MQESFTDGLVDWPHYTRPASVGGLTGAMAVLASGDQYGNPALAFAANTLGRTWLRRPELLERRGMSREERALIGRSSSER